MLQVTYGRIRARGTQKAYVFASKEEVLHKLKSILRKRASAYKRLGCAYKLVDYQGDSFLNEIDLQPFHLTAHW